MALQVDYDYGRARLKIFRPAIVGIFLIVFDWTPRLDGEEEVIKMQAQDLRCWARDADVESDVDSNRSPVGSPSPASSVDGVS